MLIDALLDVARLTDINLPLCGICFISEQYIETVRFERIVSVYIVLVFSLYHVHYQVAVNNFVYACSLWVIIDKCSFNNHLSVKINFIIQRNRALRLMFMVVHHNVGFLSVQGIALLAPKIVSECILHHLNIRASIVFKTAIGMKFSDDRTVYAVDEIISRII